MAAEAEHCQRDQRLGGSEPEGHPGDEPDLGVGGFDEALGQSVLEGGVDRGSVFDDASLECDERRNPAATRPADPAVEGLFAFLTLDREHVPESLFEQVGAVQHGVSLGDPGQLLSLLLGEVLRGSSTMTSGRSADSTGRRNTLMTEVLLDGRTQTEACR